MSSFSGPSSGGGGGGGGGGDRASESAKDLAKELKEEKRVEAYTVLLQEARESNLSDLERLCCVTKGVDNDGHLVMIFIPKLGFETHKGARTDAEQTAALRRMLLLFIRTAHDLVEAPYAIVFGHTSLSIMSQQPLVYKYYKMLPRAYKKNLFRLYILHPTILIRSFFEMGIRWFVSDKFYRKLQFIDSILDFQKFVSPFTTRLPSAFIRQEEEDRGIVVDKKAFVAPLAETFDAALGTTPLIHACTTYLRKNGGLERQGIFRVAGEDMLLTLAKVRLLSSNKENWNRIVIGGGDEGNAASSSSSSSSSFSSSKSKEPLLATVVITDLDTIAQVLKMALRDMPEPLFTYNVFEELMEAAKRFDANKSMDEWEMAEYMAMEKMPAPHTSTITHLFTFFGEVASNASVNSMDVDNISRVLSPTLLRNPVEEVDPVKAYAEVALGKTILKNMLSKFVAGGGGGGGGGDSGGDGGGKAGASSGSSEEAAAAAAALGAGVDPRLVDRLRHMQVNAGSSNSRQHQAREEEDEAP